MSMTVDEFCGMIDPCILGSWASDFLFLPMEPTNEQLWAALRGHGVGPNEILPLLLDLSSAAHDHDLLNGPLPLDDELPAPVLRHLVNLAAMGSNIDWLVPRQGIPYTHVSYLVREDGLIAEIAQAVNLFRLGRISQLGFIHQPEASRVGMQGLSSRFGHTRLNHSFHVAVLMALMLANNRQAFSERDCLHGVIGALLHDLMTPAGGDTIKLLDRAAFDEDANFGRLFGNPRWRQVAATYGLDDAQLLAIVQETCLLGRLKDVADKLAYVVLDAFMMLNAIRYTDADGSCAAYDAVSAHIKAHPFVGDVWEDVRIINGQVVFTDARRLAALLKLRALMFRDLYHNPETRYAQFVYVECILRRLYERGQVTATQLLDGDDYDIMQLLTAQLSMPWTEHSMEGLGRVHTRRFATQRQARQHMRRRRLNGGLVLFEDLSRPINSGTSFLVLNGQGRVQPLQRALPGVAAEIDGICRQACQAIVYHLPNPHWRLARVLQRGPQP